VFLEAARRLGCEPQQCAAIEDSRSGIEAAAAAGMLVVAVPRPDYAPGSGALSLADEVLSSLGELNLDIFTGSMRA
jgi:beta-phosphoglucomutase-like phosphatase (HAD superfamily)